MSEVATNSAEPLIFLMGKFAASIPTDRHYAKAHVWLSPLDSGFRVGLTAYAVRLLQDVYFLDWQIDPGTVVRAKTEIGQIESSKAVSSLYAPADATITQFNSALLNDPSLINSSPYDAGWLYDMQTTDPLWTPHEYYAHLEATWETTQRLLKSQYNE